jgi:hypothetical protein
MEMARKKRNTPAPPKNAKVDKDDSDDEYVDDEVIYDWEAVVAEAQQVKCMSERSLCQVAIESYVPMFGRRNRVKAELMDLQVFLEKFAEVSFHRGTAGWKYYKT